MNPLSTFKNLSKSKQDRIIRVALEEFGNKGYQRASINQMVKRLGIAKGSIFQYFGDKKGLFRFAFMIATEKVKDYLRTVRDETKDDDLFTRLRATLQAGIIFLRKNPVIYRLYIKMTFEYEAPFQREILKSLREYSIKYLRSLLEDAKAKGELRENIDLDAACFVLDAIMDRFLQTHVVPHLDAGLGIYNCPGEKAGQWIISLTEIMRKGIGI